MGGSVALLGGTGRSGPGLALRFALAGMRVHIGSRQAEKGEATAAKVGAVAQRVGGDGVGEITGHANAEAAALASTVLITVPYEGQASLLPSVAEAVATKVVVCTVVPVRWDPHVGPVAVAVPEGSAAEQAAGLLPAARVAAGFHSLSSSILGRVERGVDSDVVVLADDEEAKRVTMELAELLPGVRAVDGGALRHAREAEALTILLLSINRANKAHVGVRITDLRER